MLPGPLWSGLTPFPRPEHIPTEEHNAKAVKCGGFSSNSLLWNGTRTLPWCKFRGYYMKEPATVLYSDWSSLEEFQMVIIHWHSLGEDEGNKKNCKWEPLRLFIRHHLVINTMRLGFLGVLRAHYATSPWLCPSQKKSRSHSCNVVSLLTSAGHGQPGLGVWFSSSWDGKEDSVWKGKQGEHTIRRLCPPPPSPTISRIPDLSRGQQ